MDSSLLLTDKIALNQSSGVEVLFSFSFFSLTHDVNRCEPHGARALVLAEEAEQTIRNLSKMVIVTESRLGVCLPCRSPTSSSESLPLLSSCHSVLIKELL